MFAKSPEQLPEVKKIILLREIREILSRLCCPGEILDSQFKKKRHFQRILTLVKTSLEPLAPDELFKNSFFRNISKTVWDVENMYIIFVRLSVYINLLRRHILVSPTVLEIQGFEKSQKTPTPNFREILLRLCCPGETLNSQLRLIF